ncbi:ribosomal protection-like ABC-F family protein [Jeotgalibacillus salarius]|uniref:ABC-F type ribosomal protection protein n=1 Tax=Jeotgalibacillus salarius TaxID=546023 RepID=A0A4Y8LM54_9BACL|nr:ABC-F type ribosomal protection protein [Jeotgalibacillus salarius]TFE02337.1 ABC-F type ribosomal protection protein [Jeotgalibacillus salarius]
MLLKAENIAKMMGGNIIFEDMTIEVKDSEIIGLVGPNGCGKTTLLKLLTEKEPVDSGRIIKKKGLTLGYLHQIPSYPEGWTGNDVLLTAFEKVMAVEKQMKVLEQEMALASPEELDHLLIKYGDLQEQFAILEGYERDAKVQAVINGLQLNRLVDMPFNNLSGGEQTKIMLGTILLTNPDLLVLDEPTNHLDMDAIEWLETFIKTHKGAVLMVSHDRHFLNQTATRIVEIEDGETYSYKGNFEAYVKAKEERIMQEFHQFEEQQKKIKKMKEAIRRLRQWANEANPPNEKLFKKAKSMEKALERMERVKKPVTVKKMSLTLDAADRSGKDAITFEAVGKRYEHWLFRNVDLSIKWQDHIGIVGGNGAGKSTLIKMITGDTQPDEGVCRIGSNVKVGYLSQLFSYRDPSMRVIDVFREHVSITEGDARHVLARFLFYGYDVFKKVENLSGGERMRLRLAQLMHDEINLLVLDEPTNHLDIESREVLEETLQQFEGTIIAVSHDRYFLNAIFDRTAWIENGELTVYEGAYDWAREKRPVPVLVEKAEKAAPVEKPVKKKEKKPDTEVQIAALEKQLEALDLEIESVGDDWEAYEHLTKERLALQTELDQLYEEWMMQES